jgi:hypothetical protein
MSLVIPQPPVITNIGTNFFTINVLPNNPVGTYYAIQVIFNGTGGFVTAQGTIQPVMMWINTTLIQVNGLTPGNNYSIRLSAADDSIGTNSTAFGTTTNITTLNGTVNSGEPGTAFTSAEQVVIQHVRCLLPEVFSRNTRDAKILCYAGVILADINAFTPYTSYTITDVVGSPTLAGIFYFGVSLMTELFMQMRATLEDFQYNDNGLSLNVDQVGKIAQAYQNMLEFYRNMIVNFKKALIFGSGVAGGVGGGAGGGVGAVGLGTPRYQSQIGQFLKISLGSAFSWNVP